MNGVPGPRPTTTVRGSARAGSRAGRMPAGRPLARLPFARLLLAGLLLNVLLVAGIIPGTRLSALAATTSPAVRVDVDEVSPPALTPGALLTVKGRITNTGTAPLTRLLVNLRTRWNPLATRAEVQQWASGDNALISTAVHRIDSPVPLSGPLAPGATAEFTLQASPAAILGLNPDSSFGTRGLVVRVRAQVEAPPLQRAGEAYTFLVWSPGKDGVQPTRLTVLAPVTSTLPQPDASAPQEALLASMTQTGRLGRLLATVREGSLSWAVDPALLVAAQRIQAPAVGTGGADQGQGPPASWSSSPTSPGAAPGTTPSAPVSGTSPPAASGSPSGSPSAAPGQGQPSPSPELATATRAWLSQAVTLGGSQRPFALPFGDPDLAAIAHAGQDAADLLGLARSLADTATRQMFGD
ncbi:MAG TPA: hypothetical protein VFP72_18975, partial [Kineosporiaceae bacterium]|nr:hypothetical protein [Kineosporiaceae bacterium]